MKFHLEKVPFDSAKLPQWLERQLVGDHLGELIEELLAVRPPPQPLDFDAWFAPLRERILSAGLASIPRDVLRQLLTDPPALRKLQAEVLLGGGRFWDEVPRPKGFRRRAAATRPAAPTVVPRTPAKTPLPSNHRPARPTPPEPVPLTVAPSEPEPPTRRPVPVWVVVLAVAATVAVSGVAVAAVLVLSAPRG